MYTIIVDLKGVKTAEEMFDRFQEVFQFAYYDEELDALSDRYGYLDPHSEKYKEIAARAKEKKIQQNWDSFNDSFTSLDSDSVLYKKKIAPEKNVHLIVKNIDDVDRLPIRKNLRFYTDYLTLLNTLVCATNKAERSEEKTGADDVSFTFEVMNDEA